MLELNILLNLSLWIHVFLGVIIGIVGGVLPGISVPLTLAILTPFTFGMDPYLAMALLTGAYVGGTYGGSISATLLNMPGTPAAIVTTLDAHPMAKRGQAGKAIGYATISSSFGGVVGFLLLVTLFPLVAKFALKFQSPEYTLLAVFGLTLIAHVSTGSILKGLIGGVLGMMIASIGMDPITGYPRFTFGFVELQGDFPFLPVVMGLFCVPEVFKQLENIGNVFRPIQDIKNIVPPLKEMITHLGAAIKSSIIGFIVGAIPAAGTATASIVAYAQEKRNPQYADKMGTGVPRGIVASETANNGCCAGSFVPTLALGIPGDPVTAVLIGAFILHGITPGPTLFRDNSALVAVIYFAFIVGTLLLLPLGLSGAPLFSRTLTVPSHLLYPAILILCITGAYSIRNNIFDIWLLLIFGAIGYCFNKIGVPVAAVVLGLLLGPIFENNFRRTLMLSEGSYLPFVTRPISLIIIGLSLFILFYPLINQIFSRFKNKKLSDSNQA